MATLTIQCGPSHKARRCGPSHKGRRPQKQTVGSYFGNISTSGAQKFSTKPTTRKMTIQGPAVAAAIAPRGAWGNGRFRLSNQQVTEFRRTKHQVQTSTGVGECRYCHENHDIQNCHKLKFKNQRRVEWAEKEAISKQALKDEMAQQKRDMAEALLAERVRKAMEKKNPEPVEEDSESESDYSDEEDEKSLRRRVTFANDSDCLMKPEPTQVKEFDTTEPATAVSSDEEDTVADATYFASKRSAGAWQPRRREDVIHEDTKVSKLKNELVEMEKELAGMDNDSWADACDIDDLEGDIDDIKKQLRCLMSAI